MSYVFKNWQENVRGKLCEMNSPGAGKVLYTSPIRLQTVLLRYAARCLNQEHVDIFVRVFYCRESTHCWRVSCRVKQRDSNNCAVK